MSQFLVVITQVVVDSPAVKAVAAIPAIVEVVEDLNAVPPVVGVAAVAAVPAIAAAAAVTHDEVSKAYIEDSAAQVARNIANPIPNMKIYSLKYNAQLKPMIKTVREKGRASAPAKEVVTIEDQDGNELGSAEI
jgi:hypothetical protein